MPIGKKSKAWIEAVRQNWRDPAIRAKRSAAMAEGARRRYADPAERRRASRRAKALHRSPKYRARWLRALKFKGLRSRGVPRGALGLAKSPEYSVWQAMVQRCASSRYAQYKDYGGRGIRVDPAWRGRGGFARFYAHVGPRPSPKHTIGRVDNDGHYEPGNVRWETRLEQMANSRRNRRVTIGGVTLHVAEWARRSGLSEPVLHHRIKAGWAEAELLRPTLSRRECGLRAMKGKA